MRAYLPDYEAVSATSLIDALQRLAEPLAANQPAWQPLAGGTDVMVLFAAGKLPAGRYLNLLALSELRGIKLTPTHVELGALTTYTDVRYHRQLQTEYPALVQAAAESGALAIQNRGTLGGNIANASPAADTPPALLIYDAQIELVSLRGTRVIPYAEFHTGYKQTQRAADELVARVYLPRRPGHSPGRDALPAEHLCHYYRKVGTRRAQAISKVCFAGFARCAERQPDVLIAPRIALGSVAPVPLRCIKTEAVLAEGPLTKSRLYQAQQMLAQEIRPIDDVRSTTAYRRQVAENLLGDFVKAALRVPMDALP